MSNIKMIPLAITAREVARFQSKIKKDSPDKCWHWKGAPSEDGYGRFSIVRNGKTMKIVAHRLSFFLYWKIDPEEYSICHECDNPICCNPLCLFSGTQQDNMLDKKRKGRSRGGHGGGGNITRRILNDDEIVAIRVAFATEIPRPTITSLAKRFGTCRGNASMIINHKTWRSLPIK